MCHPQKIFFSLASIQDQVVTHTSRKTWGTIRGITFPASGYPSVSCPCGMCTAGSPPACPDVISWAGIPVFPGSGRLADLLEAEYPKMHGKSGICDNAGIKLRNYRSDFCFCPGDFHDISGFPAPIVPAGKISSCLLPELVNNMIKISLRDVQAIFPE